MMTKTVFILAGALAALPAMAETITFTISATGSGILGDTSFSDETITFTQVTDTADISDTTSECSFGYPCAPDAINTVTIGSVTETLSGDTYFFDNASDLVGITNEGGLTYLSADDPTFTLFKTYGMTTSFGPESASVYSTGLSDLSTSGGDLSATFSGDATFSAVLGSPVGTAVPEPRSLGLVLVAAIALAASLSRRRKLRLSERAN